MSNFIRDLTTSVTAIADGAETELLSAKRGTFRRLCGYLRSDQDLTLKLYQGLTPAGDWAEVETQAVSAGGADDGDGADFEFGLTCKDFRLTAANASGSDTTLLEFEATLDQGSPAASSSSGVGDASEATLATPVATPVSITDLDETAQAVSAAPSTVASPSSSRWRTGS